MAPAGVMMHAFWMSIFLGALTLFIAIIQCVGLVVGLDWNTRLIGSPVRQGICAITVVSIIIITTFALLYVIMFNLFGRGAPVSPGTADKLAGALALLWISPHAYIWCTQVPRKLRAHDTRMQQARKRDKAA